MTRFSAVFLFAVFCLFLIGERALAQEGGGSRVRVAIVTDEADAVLSILAKKQSNQAITESDWQRVFSSEGYARLKKRQLAMRNSLEDADFRVFVLSDALFERGQSLTDTFAKWKETDALLELLSQSSTRRCFLFSKKHFCQAIKRGELLSTPSTKWPKALMAEAD